MHGRPLSACWGDSVLLNELVEDAVVRPVRSGVSGVGSRFIALTDYVAGFTYLTLGFIQRLFHKWDRRDWNLFVEQVIEVGTKSLFVALITAAFTGMAVALQLSYGLARFGAKTYVGIIVSFALVRELAPVLVSLLVGARVGSGMTAEIGSMAVTEQIDALRALGSDPIRRLVVPRVLACIVVFPILTVLADIVGVFGGMVISYLESGVGTRFFMESVLRSLKAHDVASGVSKTVFFGAFVGLVACKEGLQTRGGTLGLGRATKTTVVVALILVLISDFLLSKLFLLVGW